MNERIDGFEKQCWDHRIDGVLVDGHLHFDTKKFALLIIKECIEIVEPCKCGCRCDEEVAITDSIIADIKEHFGVEE